MKKLLMSFRGDYTLEPHKQYNGLDQVIMTIKRGLQDRYRNEGLDFLSNYLGNPKDRVPVNTRSVSSYLRKYFKDNNDYDVINIHQNQIQVSPIKRALELTNAKVLVTFHTNPIGLLSYGIGLPNLSNYLTKNPEYRNRLILSWVYPFDKFDNKLSNFLSNHNVRDISVPIPNPVILEVDGSTRKNRKFKYISVGRIEPNREILRAVIPQAKSNPNDTFVLIGAYNDDYAPNLASNAKVREELSKLDNVIVIENLPHEEVMNYLANSEYYMMISKSESFSLATIEAIRMGCVVLNYTNPMFKDGSEVNPNSISNRIVNYDSKYIRSFNKRVADVNSRALTEVSDEDYNISNNYILDRYRVSNVLNKYENLFNLLLQLD